MEFKLLRAFLEHAGAVLSLDRLIEIVWGKDVFLTDHVIYTHINNRRAKIKRDPRNPRHIVSVRIVKISSTRRTRFRRSQGSAG